MVVVPYIHFAGNARAALTFYSEVFKGKIEMLSTYGDSPMSCDEDWKDKILHARMSFGENNLIMISDTMKGNAIHTKGNIQLSVAMKDEAEMRIVFENLSVGGNINMPLEKQFWGSLFGMLTDQFGVAWMFNCEL